MLAVTHTLTSAALGVSVANAPLAFGLAFLFHLFADTLLHWNIYVDRHRWPYFWTAVDVVGGVAVAAVLLGRDILSLPVLAAIIGGNLPDIIAGVFDLAHWRHGPFLRFHDGLQLETANPWKGLVWQGALIVVAVALIR